MSMLAKQWDASGAQAPSEEAPVVRSVPRHVTFASAECGSVSQQAYDRFAAKFLGRYLCSRSRSCAELWLSLELARVALATGGEVSERQAARLKESLIRDLAQ